ncbi:MAG: hypothetical protein ACSHW4_10300 [Cellulophaga sp.]
MNENLTNLLTDNSEIILDSLIDNEILKEIPIIGNSINIIRGIRSIRDNAYLKKVKVFIDNLGELSESEKNKLIEESKKDVKRRVKFGNAIFTTIEKSDSLIKIEYLALAFEAFLNNEFPESDLRHLCHIINNSFTDDLIDVIENETPKGNLKFLVGTGLADVQYPKLTFDMDHTEPKYILSDTSDILRRIWIKYKKE